MFLGGLETPRKFPKRTEYDEIRFTLNSKQLAKLLLEIADDQRHKGKEGVYHEPPIPWSELKKISKNLDEILLVASYWDSEGLLVSCAAISGILTYLCSLTHTAGHIYGDTRNVSKRKASSEEPITDLSKIFDNLQNNKLINLYPKKEETKADVSNEPIPIDYQNNNKKRKMYASPIIF